MVIPRPSGGGTWVNSVDLSPLMQPSCLERAARSTSVTELFPQQPQGSAYRRNSPGCVNVNASRKYSQSRSTPVCRSLFSLLDLDLYIIVRWIMEGRFPPSSPLSPLTGWYYRVISRSHWNLQCRTFSRDWNLSRHSARLTRLALKLWKLGNAFLLSTPPNTHTHLQLSNVMNDLANWAHSRVDG